jgi:nitrate reductase NapD
VNVSGIAVHVVPSRLEEGVCLLGALPGVEVQFADAARGRIVVTQEAESTEEQEEGLRRIQALPGLVSAELVCHYFGEPQDDAAGPARAPRGEGA